MDGSGEQDKFLHSFWIGCWIFFRLVYGFIVSKLVAGFDDFIDLISKISSRMVVGPGEKCKRHLLNSKTRFFSRARNFIPQFFCSLTLNYPSLDSATSWRKSLIIVCHMTGTIHCKGFSHSKCSIQWCSTSTFKHWKNKISIRLFFFWLFIIT